MKITGVGKNRFSTLNAAARNGDEHPPYDARFVIRGQQPASPEREIVHHFLMQLYLHSAEHIPDKLNSNKRPRHAPKKFDSPNMDRNQLKHLPNGSITEYWQQCVAANPGVHIGRKLFCSDLWLRLVFDVSFLCYYFTLNAILLVWVRSLEAIQQRVSQT